MVVVVVVVYDERWIDPFLCDDVDDDDDEQIGMDDWTVWVLVVTVNQIDILSVASKN